MNISRSKTATKIDGAFKSNFSVLTYNILADCHVVPCRSEAYHYVDDMHLLKSDELNSPRHLLMMEELNHFNCDILLLQEIEDWYSPLLESELRKSGYEYIFFQKVGMPEGCALCYKKDKLECVQTLKFFIHDEVTKVSNEEGLPDVVINQMAESNISIIATLKDIKTGKVIICATTHIVYDEFAEPAIQCLQACLICQKIREVRKEVSTTLGIGENDISIVFGGDFNGEPHHMNIQLMKNGKLTDSQLKTLETLTYKIEERKAVPMEFYETCHVSKYLSKYLHNPLKLSSAFFDATGGEPILTQADGTYVGTLDYIFYTPNLKVISVIDVDAAVAEAYNEGGPTEKFASDHLPLAVTFGY